MDGHGRIEVCKLAGAGAQRERAKLYLRPCLLYLSSAALA